MYWSGHPHSRTFKMVSGLCNAKVRAHPKPDVAANLWPKHGISDPGTWGIAMSIITYTYIHIYIYTYIYIRLK